MSKSSETALSGIQHFYQTLKTKPVRKEKVDLINSVISIHGKDSPEVFFFGTNFVRDWVLSITEAVNDKGIPIPVDPAVIDSLFATAVLSCINSINFFRAKSGSTDASLITVAFNLLVRLLAEKLDSQDTKVPGISSLQALCELITSELLISLTPDASSVVLSASVLLVQLTNGRAELPSFIKKDLIQFCIDFIHNYEQPVVSDDPETVDGATPSLLLNSVTYLAVCFGMNSPFSDLLVSRLFSKPRILETLISGLIEKINSKFFLFSNLRLVSQVLSYGEFITAGSSDGGGEDMGLFGYISSESSPVKTKLPDFFDSVDMEVLDDVFTSYSNDDVAEVDSLVVVALAAIGTTMVKYYSRSNTTRSVLVQSTVKKWALSALLSGESITASCGLSLVGTIHVASKESVSLMIAADSFKECLVTMKRRSRDWAKGEAFAFISSVTLEETDEPLVAVFLDQFTFHYKIMYFDFLKRAFFKNVSMKEAFARLLGEIREPATLFPEIRVVVRVMLQMTSAVKAKGAIADFQAELLRVEQSRQTGQNKGSVIVGLIRAIKLSFDNHDETTGEVAVHLITELVNPKPDRLVDTVCALFEDESSRTRMRSILDQSGKHRLPDLSLDSDVVPQSRDCVTEFIEAGFVVSEEQKPAIVSKRTNADKPADSAADEGWLDSAANWFVDYAGGDDDEDDEDEGPEEEEEVEKPVKAKKSKHEKNKKEVVEEDEEGDEDDGAEDEVGVSAPVIAPVVKAPAKSVVVPVKKPAAPVKAAPKVVAGKALPPKAVPVKVAPKGAPVKAVPGKAPVKALPPKVGAPVAKKAPVPVKAPSAQPTPPPEPEEPPKKEKKKKAKEEDAGIGAMFGSTDELYNSLGGWFGSAAAPAADEKKVKKKKKEEPVVAPPPPVKAPPPVAKKAAPAGKAPPPKVAPKGVPVKKAAPVPVKK